MAGIAGLESPVGVRRQNGCFVCGPDNPQGLHIRFRTAGEGAVEADWTPPPAVEGYVGYVHGGVVAAVLDEAMSKAVAAVNVTALTAHLEVRYRHPARTGERYRIEGHVSRRDKRRIFVRARLLDLQNRARAEATACFVCPR